MTREYETPILNDGRSPSILYSVKEEIIRDFASHHDLTQREYEVFTGLISGMARSEIAHSYSRSFKTMDSHTSAVYRKLGVNSKEELFCKFWVDWYVEEVHPGDKPVIMNGNTLEEKVA